MSEECNHDCEHCGKHHASEEECRAAERREAVLGAIKHKLVVLSGKGGVGKSTVAVNLAFGLASSGAKVGLLDVDLHGPSIPTMLGLKGSALDVEDGLIVPHELSGVKVVSVDFFLPDPNQAVIWRGPMKNAVIQQLLSDVTWGELDYLVVDCPPGTGDEPLSICQLLQDGDVSAVVVTTPQEVAAADVRKSLDFCEQLKLPVRGVLENMSGFVCPHCGKVTYIFKQGGGERLAEEAGVPFLGRIPIDPSVGEACDEGTPFLQANRDSAAAKAFVPVVNTILQEK
ncbi:MAG: Mrp/NBP35 family ATP-binding protein [Victivallales bacterium]|nr:Mrp/NBP35 family ATP-binding protein [Victivallales bacterium]